MADISQDNYLAVPKSGKGAGVLVPPAWWGLNDFFKDLCQRLAHEGFVAFANDFWFSPWTSQTVLWVVLAFVITSILQYPFVFFFDTILTRIGFLYVYFWALPQALVLYFIIFKFRVRWSSTLLMGLFGIVGAPVDYYFEWVVQKNLLSPVHAFLYIPLYFLVGLSADISLILLRPKKRPLRAALLSSCIFTLTVLATTIFATFFFYPMPTTLQGTWLGYGDFLIPYSLITGAIGGYIGYSVARDTNNQRSE